MPTREQRPGSKRGPDPRYYDPDLQPEKLLQHPSSDPVSDWPYKAAPFDPRRYLALYYRARVSGGICVGCSRPGIALNRKRCAACLKHERDAAKKRADERRAAGQCTKCGERANPPGRYCRNCREKDSARSRRRYAELHKPKPKLKSRAARAAVKRRHRRKAAGQCPTCTAPIATGRSLCRDCLRDRRIGARERVANWAAAGRCRKCGRAVSDGRRCGKCRAKSTRYKRGKSALGFCQCGGFRVRGRASCAGCLRRVRDCCRRRRAAAKRKESL